MGLLFATMVLLTGCGKKDSEVIEGDWVSFTDNEIVTPNQQISGIQTKLLVFKPYAIDKLSFKKGKMSLSDNPSNYKLNDKKDRISVGSYDYSYKLNNGKDVLKFGPASQSEAEWKTYYRVGSRQEKSKKSELIAEKEQEGKSVEKLNQTWKVKSDQLNQAFREAMVGTWSGYFSSVPTTGDGVAWAPGLETLTFDENKKVSFQASSSSLTNFAQKEIHNDYLSYQLNGLLGLKASDQTLKNPEKLLVAIKDLTVGEMFQRIKSISYRYDVTTEAGTISQAFSTSRWTYNSGKLTFDSVLLITQCGDEGVQLSGNISKN